MADEIKGKIIWALGYVKSNIDHIEELAEEYELSLAPKKHRDNWILSEEEADEIIRKVEEIWQKK
tara:strand:+ start:1706 stop:1900 length:195 start_codon:yes stop_codon:yes gene_type:complete